MSKKIAFPLTQSEGPVADKASQDYETAGHLKTLMDAHEIINNPEHMKRVHALSGRHKKALTSIKDLKDTYQNKFGTPMNNKKPDDGDGDESL